MDTDRGSGTTALGSRVVEYGDGRGGGYRRLAQEQREQRRLRISKRASRSTPANAPNATVTMVRAPDRRPMRFSRDRAISPRHL